MLETLTKFEIRLVRIWLFENGEGILHDEHGLPMDVEPKFEANLRTLIELLRRHQIRAYWTLLDANSVRRRADAVA
jgi:hypothetical protein